MGLTKQYLRYVHADSCNAVGSANGAVVAVDANVCATAACDSVNFYSMRTQEMLNALTAEKKSVTCLAMSDDRRYLATGYSDGSTRLYDRKADDPKQFISFHGHKTGVNCIAFSNDGLTLATGGKDSTIVLWDLVAESGIVRLNGHKDSITRLQFTRDDRFIVSSSKDTLLKVWHVDSHACIYTICDHKSEVYSFVLLHGDTFLVTASAELELLIYDFRWIEASEQAEGDADPASKKAKEAKKADGDEEDEGVGEDMANPFVRISLAGRLLRQSKGRALQLTASHDERLVLCLGSGQIVDVFRVYTSEEASKRVSKKLRKAKRKAAGSGDDAPSADDISRDVTVKIARIGEWTARKDKVKWADLAPTATLEDDSELKEEVDDDDEDESVEKMRGKKKAPKESEDAAKKKKQSRVVYTAFVLCKSNTVRQVRLSVDLDTNDLRTEEGGNLDKLGHRSDVRALAVASNNSSFVTGGGDQLILWNLHTLRPVNTMRELGMDDVTAVGYATGENYIIAGTKSGGLFVFCLGSTECVEARPTAHGGAIWQITPTPDKLGFVTCSADKQCKFWLYALVEEGGGRKRLAIRESRQLEVPDEALSCAVAPNGKFLVVGLLNATLSVYYMDTLRFFVSLYGHSLPVTSVTISPDSKLAVSGSADKTIKIWGLDFGDCHKSFHAHDEAVASVLFSPSEEMLVWSAGRDGKIKQWDAVKREHVQTLSHHTAEVRALAQNPDGNVMLSASHDRSVRCWELTEEIIVLEEEEEMEREEQFDAKFLHDDDVIPGETQVETGEDGQPSAVATLATAKNKQSIASTEHICDAVEIARKERAAREEDPDHKMHPYVASLGSPTLEHFIVDVTSRVQPSNLERALLMVPFGFVPDLLRAFAATVKAHYKTEFSTRVALYLMRIHHAHVTNSAEMMPLVDQLRKEIPQGLREVAKMYGFNLAALRLLQLEYEEMNEVRLFDEDSVLNPKKAAKKKKKVFARKALVKTVA